MSTSTDVYVGRGQVGRRHTCDGGLNIPMDRFLDNACSLALAESEVYVPFSSVHLSKWRSDHIKSHLVDMTGSGALHFTTFHEGAVSQGTSSLPLIYLTLPKACRLSLGCSGDAAPQPPHSAHYLWGALFLTSSFSLDNTMGCIQSSVPFLMTPQWLHIPDINRLDGKIWALAAITLNTTSQRVIGQNNLVIGQTQRQPDGILRQLLISGLVSTTAQTFFQLSRDERVGASAPALACYTSVHHHQHRDCATAPALACCTSVHQVEPQMKNLTTPLRMRGGGRMSFNCEICRTKLIGDNIEYEIVSHRLACLNKLRKKSTYKLPNQKEFYCPTCRTLFKSAGARTDHMKNECGVEGILPCGFVMADGVVCEFKALKPRDLKRHRSRRVHPVEGSQGVVQAQSANLDVLNEQPGGGEGPAGPVPEANQHAPTEPLKDITEDGVWHALTELGMTTLRKLVKYYATQTGRKKFEIFRTLTKVLLSLEGKGRVKSVQTGGDISFLH